MLLREPSGRGDLPLISLQWTSFSCKKISIFMDLLDLRGNHNPSGRLGQNLGFLASPDMRSMELLGGRSRELSIEEWDEVDVVWARAVSTEGVSVWESIVIVAKEMEEEKRVWIRSLCDRDELK